MGTYITLDLRRPRLCTGPKENRGSVGPRMQRSVGVPPVSVMFVILPFCQIEGILSRGGRII
jgi:hypothetical protein